ncbi:hypothetical protein [Nonomuraea angiospora]
MAALRDFADELLATAVQAQQAAGETEPRRRQSGRCGHVGEVPHQHRQWWHAYTSSIGPKPLAVRAKPMFEPTDNQLVNIGLFLLDVFLSYWYLWAPWIVLWWIFEGRHKYSSGGSGGSGGSSYRHDGAGGDGGSNGGDGGGGDGGD